MAISRSRMALLVQLLTIRNSLGKSEVFKRGRELRPRLKSAMAFAISAHENTSVTPARLVQHDRLINYAEHMPTILLQAAYGNDKGSFNQLNPVVITRSVEELLTQRKSRRALAPARLRWADPTINQAAAIYLDRYFHFLGWDNGAFTAFMKTPNKLLTTNTSLPDKLLKVLRLKVSAAVMTGLAEIGEEWTTFLQAESHLAIFPQQGKTLVAADSAFEKALKYVQHRLDRLDDDEFWDGSDDEQITPSTSRDQTSKEQTLSKEQALKNEIKGMSPTQRHAVRLLPLIQHAC